MSLDEYIVSVRLEAPSKRRQAEFLRAARRTRSLHCPWIEAPTDALTFAAELAIEHPEEIRVMEVKSIPLPAPRPLVKLASRWGLPLFEPAGMTLGRGIYVLEGHARVLRHELVHVAQFQRLGGIEPFMRCYLAECLTHGYHDAPLEAEAREKQ